MAYDHTQYEVQIGTDVDLNSAAQFGAWSPGLTPHILRGIAVVVTNDIGAAGEVTVEYGTAGVAAGAGTTVDIINLTTAHTAGTVVYKDGLNQKLTPGQEVLGVVTNVTAASDTAHVILMVEPQWEQPANNTSMSETA